MQKKIIIGIIIIAILLVAFLWGGNAPESETVGSPAETEMPMTEAPTEKPTEQPIETKAPTAVPSAAPTEEKEETASEEKLVSVISVNCSTVLSNMEYLEKGKEAIIPKDGVILPPTQVVFYEGETIFQVLRRTLKEQGVHLEYTNTPIYNTAYIEGIGNLYEFDCGELSGWVYRVNGSFPGYGCSRYILSAGDRVEFLYTCNLGDDVGGNNIAK